MRETRAWDVLKKLYPKAHFQRLESWTSEGILDGNGCQDGVEVWIELKQCKEPKTKRGRIKPKVRSSQTSWEILRRTAGGKTFVALMVGDKFYLLPGWSIHELYNGISQGRLLELKLDEKQMFSNGVTSTR